jgi:hypothetical protein
MLSWTKRLLLTGAIVGLLASNILTLTNAAFNAALSGALATATGVRTVSGLLQAKIASQQKTITRQASREVRRKAATRRFGTRLANRTKRVATKSLAAIPAESIPVIGIGVLLADTGYELYAACETLRDVNQLYLEMGMKDAVAEDSLHQVCNPELPDSEQVWSDVMAHAEQWWGTLLESAP